MNGYSRAAHTQGYADLHRSQQEGPTGGAQGPVWGGAWGSGQEDSWPPSPALLPGEVPVPALRATVPGGSILAVLPPSH